MTLLAPSGAMSDDPDAPPPEVLYTSAMQPELLPSTVPITDRPWFVATIVIASVTVLCALVFVSFILYRRRRRGQTPLSTLLPAIPPQHQLPLSMPLPQTLPSTHHDQEKPVLTYPSAASLKRFSTQSFVPVGDHRTSYYNSRDSGSHSYSHSQRHSRSRNLSRNLSRSLSRNLSRNRAMTPEQLIMEQENQRQLVLQKARQDAAALGAATASSSASILPINSVPPYTASQISNRDSSPPDTESANIMYSMPPPIHENEGSIQGSSFSSVASPPGEPSRFMSERELAPKLGNEWVTSSQTHHIYAQQKHHIYQEQLHHDHHHSHLYQQQQAIMQQVYIAEDEVYSTDSEDDCRSSNSQLSLRSEWKAFEAAAHRNQSDSHPVTKTEGESSSSKSETGSKPAPLSTAAMVAGMLSFTMETPLASPAFDHNNQRQSLIPPPLLPRRSSRRGRTRSMGATGYETTTGPRRSNGTPVLTLTVPQPSVLRKAVSTSEFLKHHRQASSMASSHLEYDWPALDFDWLPFQNKGSRSRSEEEDEEVASLSCVSPLTTIPPKEKMAAINPPTTNFPSPSSAPSSAVTAPEPRNRWSDELLGNPHNRPIDRSQSMDTSTCPSYLAKRGSLTKRLPPGGWQLQISTLDITGACPRPSIVAEDEVVDTFSVSYSPMQQQQSPVATTRYQNQSTTSTSRRSSRRSVFVNNASQSASDSPSPTPTPPATPSDGILSDPDFAPFVAAHPPSPSMTPKTAPRLRAQTSPIVPGCAAMARYHAVTSNMVNRSPPPAYRAITRESTSLRGEKRVPEEEQDSPAQRRRQSSTLASSYSNGASQQWRTSTDSDLICSSRLDGPLGDLMPGF
ncbi:hypothetical protein BROUX41_004972 [Berkeleyomyces rouxiae]|uniref:uncharacterized protein n=1 Tax=Berkeleyomyces rouxiae TaxID=2035830 RepID=UPI003B7641D5